jgi:hypothetical protein
MEMIELTPNVLAEEFAKVEKKDFRVVEVRVHTIPPSLGVLVSHPKGKPARIWGADIIEDRKVKLGKLVLKAEEDLETLTPKKMRTFRITL